MIKNHRLLPQNFDRIRKISGFEADVGKQNAEYGIGVYKSRERVTKVLLAEQPLRRFLEQASCCDIQSLEYVAFRRFALAQLMDENYGFRLSSLLKDILHDRNTGAVIVDFADAADIRADADALIKLGTAIAHLFGVSNGDAMSGKFYARFSVTAKDNSDSYLRNGERRMELHNDGTFVRETTDFVLMMKIAEKNVCGGDSLLLHLDDWDELPLYADHPLATRALRFAAPASKNITAPVSHSIFAKDEQNRTTMAYIDQFIQPADREEGLYLQSLSNSLENCGNTTAVPLPPGNTIICNNHFWLHGRNRFSLHPQLYRELMRQRGKFLV